MTALEAHDQWFKPGAEVAIIEYLGHGKNHVERATVARVTPAQIITKDGRRFWRRKSGRKLVGQTDQLNGGIPINPVRIAPIDCPTATRYFAGDHPPRQSTSQRPR